MNAFLKPSLLKVIFTLALFVAASYLWRMYIISTISDTFPLGFPLQFYLAWGPCPPDGVCSEFNWLWLVVDIIVWYMIGALILNRLKKEVPLVEKEATK